MEIKVNQVEEFEVIPEEFKGEDKPPKFIFRTPNTIDYTDVVFRGKSIHSLLFDCFLRFENKPILKDAKNKEIPYINYQGLMEIGASPVLAAIHTDCAIAMSNKIAELKEKASKTVKKSK